ncbi:MAG: aminotransferase class I/II-fold pyridoxal phosphate-dependent enzyme [Bacteroidota bacterium]|jgi:7-keto-8-aminopelargonate synthetase-like enzyme
MAKHLTNHEQNLRIVDQITSTVAGMGIAHLVIEDQRINGRSFIVNGDEVLNFGNCSYLGLETDVRLKAAAIDAIDKYGIVMSVSRAFASIYLYPELERLLTKLFESPALVSVSTTLAHASNIPVLVGDNDAVILDIQVHNCVHNAVELLRQRNIPIEKIRHNRMDILEERIQDLKDKHDKIWYMADGVYSMYGDYAPTADLQRLLDEYEQLHLYIDDAHGMSWAGKNGMGYIKSKMPKHPRLIVVVSMIKGFGTSGGVSIFPTEELRQKARNCGSTHIFSGPITNPVLGASIASARIHLSPEIDTLQQGLKERVDLFNYLAKEYELPVVHPNDSPIFFIGVGKPTVGYSMVRRLMDKGFYVNLSVFPSVSYNRTGLRMPITLHNQPEDIERLIKTIAEELPKALAEQDYSMKSIFSAFKLMK